jgi:uncharacterized protein YecT (DUF1311 family)
VASGGGFSVFKFLMEELIYFGEEIKSHGDGRFSGHLVRFSSEQDKDLAGDYFTKDTDFGIKDGQTTPIYFNHRLPISTREGKQLVIKSKIGEGTLKLDDEGVLIDAILFNREKYEKAIIKAGKAKKLGWSSGTAKHLVDREDDGFIKTWPLGLDSSITPTPCDPQNCATVKSISDIEFVSLEEFAEEIPVEVKTVSLKGLLQDKLAEQTPSFWQIQSLLYDALRDVAAAARISGVDVNSTVRNLFQEFADLVSPSAVEQIANHNQSNSQEPFYLKSKLDELIASPEALVSDAKLEEHSEVVVSAVEEFANKAAALETSVKAWIKRVSDKQEFRRSDPLKAGRVISQANKEKVSTVRSRMSELRNMMKEMEEALGELEMMAEPKKAVDEQVLGGLLADFEMIQRRVEAVRR